MFVLLKKKLQRYVSIGLAAFLSFSSLLIPEAINTNAAENTPIPTSTPALNTVVATPSNVPEAIGFKDVIDHWAKDYIQKLYSSKVISGYEDGTIKPDNKITRSEIAVMLVKALSLDIKNATANTFKDSKSIPEWALPYINLLAEKGVIKGYEDGNFRPNNMVTRAELVTMVMNAFGYKPSPNEKFKFFDSKLIPSWAAGYILKGIEGGIIGGYQDNTFKPLNKIKRCEVFVVISKCMDKCMSK